MQIVRARHERIGREDISPLQLIEVVGRTCYKSQEYITVDSAAKFVKGLIQRNHLAVTEHYWCHVHITRDNQFDTIAEEFLNDYKELMLNFGFPCLKHMEISATGYANRITDCYVSAPLRVFIELAQLSAYWQIMTRRTVRLLLHTVKDAIPEAFEGYTVSPLLEKNTDDFNHKLFRFYHSEKEFLEVLREIGWTDGYFREVAIRHMTHTVRFTCDRGVSHELVRMREQCSFAQESTRYCNYSKAKFGEEITVIKPCFFDVESTEYSDWWAACKRAEEIYFSLLKKDRQPQEARSVLPNSLKTEIIMTANEVEWQHIVDLRAKGLTGAPHPQMLEIMLPWYEELKEVSDGRIE